MAKICKACGLHYRDYATKCINCGGKLEIVQSVRRIKIAIAITLAVIIIGVTTVLLVDYYRSPISVVDKIINSYDDYDEQAVMETLPPFLIHADDLGEYELKYGLEYWYWGDIKMMSEYLFSYNIESTVDPSEAQMESLVESIKYFAGEDFDTATIEDVEMVWVDFRGGTMGYWGLHHTRFVMIKYQGEWYWWPFY